jgi:hypothetical protein
MQKTITLESETKVRGNGGYVQRANKLIRSSFRIPNAAESMQFAERSCRAERRPSSRRAAPLPPSNNIYDTDAFEYKLLTLKASR